MIRSSSALRNEIEALREQLARERAAHEKTRRLHRDAQAEADELRGKLKAATEDQYTVVVPGGEVAQFTNGLGARNFAVKTGGTLYAPAGHKLTVHVKRPTMRTNA